MKISYRDNAKKIIAVLLAAIMILTGSMSATAYSAWETYAQEASSEMAYDWQGLGNPTSTNDVNRIFLKEICGQDLTKSGAVRVIREAKNFSEYYENEIVDPVDGTEGLSFVFAMQSGMGNFTPSTFKLNNMQHIKILDKAGNVVAGEGSDTEVKLNETLSHGKTGDDKKTASIVIEAEKGAIEGGEYVLYFGSDICGNNTAKILGVPVRFDFTYEVVPELSRMVSEAKAFAGSMETYADEAKAQPGQYPASALEDLESEIKNAEDCNSDDKGEQEKKDAARRLYYKLQDTRKSVFAGIASISVTAPADQVYTGDTGTAVADVVSVPDRSDLKTVKWSVTPEDGCISIDPDTGEWSAEYAGTAVIKTVTTCGSRENKTAEKTVKVKNSKYETGENDKAASVEVSIGSGQSLESVVSKAASGRDTGRLRVITRSGACLTEEDISYINGIRTLEVLDLADASADTLKISNSSVKKIYLPDDLETVDERMFTGCDALEHTEIPASVTSVDSRAFAGCYALDPVLVVRAPVIPGFINGEKDGGFADCSITSVSVPYRCGTDYSNSAGWSDMEVSESEEHVLKLDGVKAGQAESAAAEKLRSMGLKDIDVDTLIINNSDTEDGYLDPLDKEWVKKHCMNATKLDLSGAELKDSPSETGSKLKSRTFYGRKALREMYLPDDTYQIAKQVFQDCINLRKLELPGSLSRLGDGAFRGCDSLPDTLVMNTSTPPGFDGIPFDTTRIRRFIVPSHSVDDYKASYGWKYFEILPYVSVMLDKHDMTLRNLSAGSLKAQVTLNHGTDSSVSWESDAPEVASVDQDGNINAYRSGTAEITVTTKEGHVTDSCIVTVKGIESPQIRVSCVAYNRLKISWKKISGSAGYTVYRYDRNGKLKKYWNLTASSTEFYDTALATSTTYIYKVRAYVKDDEGTVYRGDHSPAVKGTPSLAKATAFKVKAGKKLFTASWKKVSGASGYTVYYSAKKSSGFKSKTVNGNSKVKYTVKSLKKGRTYYVKARAYRTVNGKKVYGPYTSLVRVKAK